MKFFLIFSFVLAATGQAYSFSADSTKHHKMTVDEVLTKYNDTWLAIPGVTGTGEGKSAGKPCIMIFTVGDPAPVKKKIPKKVEGYSVVFEKTGEMKAR